MVGIEGGAPGPPGEKPEDDIRLGDIVVSKPGPGHGGVIQYDYGKTLSEGEFMDIGYMNRPPNILLTTLTKLLSQNELKGSMVSQYVTDMGRRYPRMSREWRHQGTENDILFAENYIHSDIHRSCKDLHCPEVESRLVARKPRGTAEPVVHCGLVASGHQIMRDSVTREKLRKKHGVLCFEMEAAGLNNNFPCLIIRGICDYSDSHKDKRWQPYAAAVSAAFAKELLGIIPAAQLERTEKVAFLTGKMETKFGKLNNNLKPLLQGQENRERRAILDWHAPGSHQLEQTETQRNWEQGTGQSFIEHPYFKAWSEGSKDMTTLFCTGLPGVGKTTMASLAISKLQAAVAANGSVVAYLYLNYNLTAEQTSQHMLRMILRQMVEALPSIPDNVTRLYHTSSSLSSHDLLQALSNVIEWQKNAFVVLDALDECSPEGLPEVLRVIQRLRERGARIMATSRPIGMVQREFRGLEKCSPFDIRATNHDMVVYIDRNFDFSAFFQLDHEQAEIDRFKNAIIGSANGMFILVRLYINILKSKYTRGEIQEELDNIVNGRVRDPIYEAYNKTTQMIERTNHREWAYRVLSWVFYARRPLTPMELREVLAAQTQRGSKYLDLNYAPPDIQKVLSCCSGLVIVSRSSGFIEFIHNTANQYFEKYQHEHSWMSKAVKDMPLACLKYVSFDPSLADPRYLSFRDYAARFWAEHTQSVQTDEYVRRAARIFLRNPSLTSAVDRAFPADDHSYLSSSLFTADAQVSGATGLHLVTRFGLGTMLKDLLDDETTCGINSRDPYGQTPLVLAVRYDHEDAVAMLLNNGNADPNLADDDGMTPLSLSSQLGCAGMVRALLCVGNANPNLTDFDGWSPIMHASRNNRIEAIQILLECGHTDVNLACSNGQTALLLAVEMGFADVVKLLLQSGRVDLGPTDASTKNLFMLALENGHRDVTQELMDGGLSQSLLLGDDESFDSKKAFWLAVEKGLPRVIEFLLQNGKADSNMSDSTGKSALMLAVENRHREVVRVLLEVGRARTDMKAMNGDTALFLAVVKRDEGIIRILLEIGKADPNLGCRKVHRTPPKYPLAYAAEKGFDDIVKLLINTGSANPNIGLKGAISQKQLGILRFLLATPSANPNTQDDEHGQTALMTAIGKHDLELVDMIFSMKGVDVNAQNWSGETALTRAVHSHSLDLVRLLVEEHGADIGIRTRYGFTALDLAESHDWTIGEAIHLLSSKKQRRI